MSEIFPIRPPLLPRFLMRIFAEEPGLTPMPAGRSTTLVGADIFAPFGVAVAVGVAPIEPVGVAVAVAVAPEVEVAVGVPPEVAVALPLGAGPIFAIKPLS